MLKYYGVGVLIIQILTAACGTALQIPFFKFSNPLSDKPGSAPAHACTYTHIHTYAHICTQTNSYTQTHTYAHTTYTYTDVHIHTWTHIYAVDNI